MATMLPNSNLTLLDWAKRLDPDGRVPIIVELLKNTNEMLDDTVVKEGNLPTGERVVIRTGLPKAYWRALNQGIPSSKSTTAQVDEACGMLEQVSEMDVDLAKLNGNTAQFRLSEDSAFIQGMNQGQQDVLLYGDPGVNPKEFLGFIPRYNDLNGQNAQNILDAGGKKANNTSILLVVWGDNTVYCPFPKGSKAGILHQDLGLQMITKADQTKMMGYVTHYQWKSGLVVKDWRYVVRIANIDIDDLMGQTGTQKATAATAIIKLMVRAMYRVPTLSNGRAAFYMNRTVHSGLAIAALDKSQYVLKVNEAVSQFGTPTSWLSFLGIPLRRVDAMRTDEPALT